MSKQTTEELAAALDVARATLDAAWLNGKPIPAPSCIQAAARVIEAMGRNERATRAAIPKAYDHLVRIAGESGLHGSDLISTMLDARAATDEVIDLMDKKVEAPNE